MKELDEVHKEETEKVNKLLKEQEEKQRIEVMEQQLETADLQDLGNDVIGLDFRRVELVFPESGRQIFTQVRNFHGKTGRKKDALRRECVLRSEREPAQSP